MKKTLIVGDSFVSDIVKTYADCIVQDYACKKIGLSGGGNTIIADTVISNFIDFDNIIINWTSACRYDILNTDKSLIKMFKLSKNTHHVIDNKFWLISGGWRGSWRITETKFIFEPLYKYHFQIEDAWRRSLQNVLLVQNLLSNNNKNFFQMFSYDMFECQSFAHQSKQDRSQRIYNKKRWKKFCNNNSWLKFIDWNKIWFNSNQYSNTGGIMDWCHDNTEDTDHHPTKEGHEQFYQSIIKPWLDQHN